jgi:glycosyltransferase involved in cell wall biosynthesis
MNESGLREVVILSYFFPPCNLTAAQRSLGWAKYLSFFGYYPIIITRNWDNPINSPDDMHHNSGNKLVIEKHPGYEVHYVPFRGNLRDRLYSKYGKKKYTVLRKSFSLIEQVSNHVGNVFFPYRDLYAHAKAYILKNKPHSMFVTANPFELFKLGYLLHKETQIPWIADYRDDWNTNEVNPERGFLGSLMQRLEQGSEAKWISNAFCITSVSPYYTQKISKYVSKPGHVLLNGFFEEDFAPYKEMPYAEKFTVVYNGMLYPTQKIEVFLTAFKQLIDKHSNTRSRIELIFPGIEFDKKEASRVKQCMKGYEDILVTKERIPRKEVLEIQARAHLLLMVAHTDIAGIPSSKIYEYLGLGKAVLICPPDGDILEETFSNYNLGFLASSAEQAFTLLDSQFGNFLNGQFNLPKADEQYTNQFTRKHQAQLLAEILDDI